MAISESRRKANDRWREKFDEMRFRVPKGKKAVIQRYADIHGESVNAFLNRAVNEAMERDPIEK